MSEEGHSENRNPMNHCIFHIGMHKTGTSSIQESLYYGLRDPSFLYFGFGEPNGSRGLKTLFGDEPEQVMGNKKLGLSGERLHRYRRSLLGQLERAMQRASTLGNTLILSAEDAWHMSTDELSRFLRFMEASQFSVKVILYLRPWKPWLESWFQQRIRVGWRNLQLVPENLQYLSYRNRILALEAIFGIGQVQLVKFDPAYFPGGCVVEDFFRRLGIRFDPARIRRVNESLSLPATRLLYTYYKLGPGFGVGRFSVLSHNLMAHVALARLKGPPVRFHSSLVASLLAELEAERSWVAERLGVPFDEDIEKDDQGECIRNESDLYRYDRGSLEWLAASIGCSPSDDPVEVAAQMHRLRHRPSFKNLVFAGKEKLDHLTCWIGKKLAQSPWDR